jgi:hypothetical protein
MEQEHSLIQAPLNLDQPLPEGARMAGCSCTGGMVGVYSAQKAYANYQDHLAAQDDLPQAQMDRLLDEAWETLTGKKS